VLRTFDPARRAVLTTDASNVAVAAILTQPDDEGHQRRLVPGVMRYLVRWRGHTSADDEWLRVEELAHC
jgi:hypothetical protein